MNVGSNLASQFISLLNNTTNSYKFLFLRALIGRVLIGQSKITLDDITLDMLVDAWYPNQYFKLSFGLQDQIGNTFKKQDFQYEGAAPITSNRFKVALRSDIEHKIDKAVIKNKLSKYVQYRTLSPFFKDELSGKSDGSKNKMIFELAVKDYDLRTPLYKIDPTRKSVTVHPSWVLYIKSCSALLKQYLKFSWVQYLQKNNPSVPAIIYKTEPPIERNNLQKERKYWDNYIEANPTETCVYSNDKLVNIQVSIDHFLPWSFVCHDQLWNLLPVDRSINSSKGNRLPALNQYLEPFIEIQHRAIVFSMNHSDQWKNLYTGFFQDLNLTNVDQLLNEQTFHQKLSVVICNQHALAQQIGFADNWRCV